MKDTSLCTKMAYTPGERQSLFELSCAQAFSIASSILIANEEYAGDESSHHECALPIPPFMQLPASARFILHPPVRYDHPKSVNLAL